MSTAQTAIIATGIIIALLFFLTYWIYWGQIRKRWSTVGNKRVWLVTMLIPALSILLIGRGILKRIVVFIIILVPGLLAGHAPAPKFVPDNRRPISGGKNIWEKIIIFLWY